MMTRQVYKLASSVARAFHLMETSDFEPRPEITRMWEDKLDAVNDQLPHGSGFDGKSYLVTDTDEIADFLGQSLEEVQKEYDPDKTIFFYTEFHHMNDGGYYVGWTEILLVVTASLSCGFQIEGHLLGGKGVIAELMAYVDEDTDEVVEFTEDDVDDYNIDFYVMDYVCETWACALEQNIEW